MQCTRAEQFIPLFAGDDLPERETTALRAHLKDCAACRQQAADFSANRDWLRTIATPAFSDAALESLRDAVHREIAAAARQPAWHDALLPNWELRFKMGLAMATAAILLVATIGLLRGRHLADRSAPFVGKTEATPSVQPRVPRSVVPDRRQQHLVRYDGRRRPGSPRRVPVVKPEPPIAPEPALVAVNTPPANPEMLRIEMQTADPNIRIIWFAPKTDASNSMNTK